MVVLGLDTTTKQVVFLNYLGLWCALRLVIYASQREDEKEYSPAALLVVTTMLKLGISVVWCWWDTQRSVHSVWQQVILSKQLAVRYIAPAASYVIYDNLMFFCLSQLDPVTYVILMQFRLPITGFVWQIVFGRRMEIVQWLGLVLVMSACILQRSTARSSSPGRSVNIALGIVGVVIQIACGVFSSVYNESMLKKGDISLHLQNIYMYTHSVICNFLWLYFTGQSSSLSLTAAWQIISSPKQLPVIILLACIGISTSLFLKHLDSVKKSIASAIELFGDAALSWYFFGIPIRAGTSFALLLCASGIILYSKEKSDPQLPISKQYLENV
eukprot:TRINITY_DN34740_c0_g1_i1.p1 TRINITY_DN34740_c0_g1~~TRINITY_DN34740_c0_g1_i1.p1  ORF type:complete len:329 (+),score=18.07 TRINITY_DN34740_c0_g1_i1:118-1104(+)